MDALLGTRIAQGEVRERHRHETMQATVLKSSRTASDDVPASPKISGKERADIATSAGSSPRAPLQHAIRRPGMSHEVTPEESELRPCSDLNPRRTGRHRTRLRSWCRRAYDSAGLPCTLDPLVGDAASRAQAVTPITTAPITAKTCRQGSDVMVKPDRPKVA